MRRMRWLGVALLVLVGCESTDNAHIKPPLREEYNLPPSDDARFSSPQTFPKEVLNQPPNKPSSPQGPGGAPKGPSRMGGGMSAGGY